MKKVAIIGAGASGIVCSKKLIDAGFEVTVFEKSSNLAGVWSYSDYGVVYDSLRTNLPKEIMVYEDEIVPYNCKTSFPNYSVVRDYLVNNTKAWNVDKVIRFDCEVIKIVPVNTNDNLTKWQIIYKYEENTITNEFDYIAVCNGHYEIPNFPKDIIIYSEVYRHLDHSI